MINGSDSGGCGNEVDSGGGGCGWIVGVVTGLVVLE